ncbi:hypothetical protein C0991_002828 [Blastosporella zonata]|nr:hypothetical protein C0991_002828 [Blastosporella zonata]
MDTTLLSTHSTRNPHKKVIAPRKNYKTASSAGRGSTQLCQKLSKCNRAALQEDVEQFIAERKRLATELAAKYNVTEKYICGRLSNALLMKQTRRPNRWNAIMSRRARELNEDRAPGNCLTMKEIQEIVKKELEDGAHNDLNEDELLEELEETRDVKARGARSGNQAALLDYLSTMRSLQQEMMNLYERTGAYRFAFFTHGHVQDSIVPGYLELQPASIDFICEVFNIAPADLARKFEQWACVRSRIKNVDTIATICNEAVNLINNGLSILLGKSIPMSYENYEERIIETHGVKLRGWPVGLVFQSPASITSIGDACMLRDALQAGECRWVQLSKEEREKQTNDRQMAIANGEVVVKKRKEQLDKGVPRGHCKGKVGEKRRRLSSDGNDAGEQGTEVSKKKARVVEKTIGKQMPRVHKSKEFIDSDDGYDDNESSDNDG